MFVVGLLVGPLLGLVIADLLFRSASLDRGVAIGILVVLLGILAFAGFLPILLRMSLLAGIPLGVLLWATPISAARSEDLS